MYALVPEMCMKLIFECAHIVCLENTYCPNRGRTGCADCLDATFPVNGFAYFIKARFGFDKIDISLLSSTSEAIYADRIFRRRHTLKKATLSTSVIFHVGWLAHLDFRSRSASPAVV